MQGKGYCDQSSGMASASINLELQTELGGDMQDNHIDDLDQAYYEEGGDSDADAFAIVSLIVIFAAAVAYFLGG